MALPPRLDIDARARSHFYQPPPTPSASHSLRTSMALSATALDTPPPPPPPQRHAPRSNTARKRSRHEFAEADADHGDGYGGWYDGRAVDSPGARSPPPLVDTRYKLAGGGAMGTPTGARMRSPGAEADGTPDIAFRRGRRYSVDGAPNDYFGRAGHAANHGIPAHGAPTNISSNGGAGWKRTVFDTAVAVAGTVAGTVWTFCTTPFRGFVAGGGRAYPLDDAASSAVDLRRASPPPWGADASPWAGVPAAPAPSPPRAAKKLKRARDSFPGEAELRGWVVVPSPGRTASPSTASVPGLRQSPAPAARHAGGGAAHGRLASAAGLRSPAAAHRPRAAGRGKREGRDGLMGAASPRASPTHRAYGLREAAAPRRESGAEAESPIAKETARYVQKMRRKERAEDKELRRFNRRLEDMIREGQEALGSRVEVVETDGDSEGDGMDWL